MSHQLLRTNLSLSGNIKLCCHINSKGVNSLKLRPVISRNPVYGINLNTDTPNFSSDITNFYTKYSDIFYKPYIQPHLSSYEIITHLTSNDSIKTTRVNSHEYGTSRASKEVEGNKHHIFAPLFVESYNDIPAYANIIIQQTDSSGKLYPEFKKKINIANDASSSLYRYIYNMLSEVDSTKIMNISSESRESLLVGRSVTSGKISYVKSDLPVQLYSRDLTFIEFDSRISTEFSRFKLICPHIINLDFYFDLNNINPNISKFFQEGKTYKINVEYFDLKGNKLDKYDIDFNHELIYNGADDENKYNILNYNYEYDISEIYSNTRQKLVPYINKWVLSSDNSYIFNNYVGFNNFTDPLTGTDVKQYNDNTKYAYNFNETRAVPNSYNLDWFDIIDLTEESDAKTYIEDSINGELFGSSSSIFNRVDLKDDTFMFNGIKYNIDIDSLITTLSNSDNIETSIQIILCNPEDSKSGKNYIYITNDYISGKIKFIDICMLVGIEEVGSDDWIYSNEIFKDKTLNYLLYNGIKIDEILLGNIDLQSQVSFSTYSSEKIYFGIEKITVSSPNRLNIINPLTCTYLDSSQDQKYLIVQSNDNIYLNRYGGWIEPRFLKVEDTSSDTNFIYNKNSEGSEVFGIYDTSVVGYSLSSEIYNNQWLEYKMFQDSTILNLPNVFNFSNYCMSSTEYNIFNLFCSAFEKIYNISDSNNLLYIYNLYEKEMYAEDNTLYINMNLK